jgi:hypothetical protein
MCREEKPVADFHRGPRGYQHWCKSCRRGYDREYHRRTRSLRLAQKRAYAAAYFKWYQGLKRGPCADCGGVFPPPAMSFDHLPGTEKVDDVANLVRKHRGKSVIMAEIRKCELVCVNCHALRSSARRSGRSSAW